MEQILKLNQVKKFYGDKSGLLTKAVNGLSFEIDYQEFVAIMGSSGSGKTTLLNCIATIDTVTSGSIIIGSKDITLLKEDEIAEFRRKELGFIFQDFNLLDTLTLEENIALTLIINKEDRANIDKRVKELATKLGIETILTKFPYEVSGGQKQRVACARALINNPALILADEPTGSLDSKSARMLLETMSTMNKELKSTILMVTHDAFSASFCKRVMFLKDGKIFSEIYKGEKSRKEFFNEILDVLTLLGGDVDLVK
jgi:putative ABC transport system ATP-binding protein